MGFEVRQVGGFAYSAHIVLKFLWTLCGVVFGLTAWGGLCFGKEKMRASSTCTSSACKQWANLFTLSMGERNARKQCCGVAVACSFLWKRQG